jgi:hypothetical protein
MQIFNVLSNYLALEVLPRPITRKAIRAMYSENAIPFTWRLLEVLRKKSLFKLRKSDLAGKGTLVCQQSVFGTPEYQPVPQTLQARAARHHVTICMCGYPPSVRS